MLQTAKEVFVVAIYLFIFGELVTGKWRGPVLSWQMCANAVPSRCVTVGGYRTAQALRAQLARRQAPAREAGVKGASSTSAIFLRGLRDVCINEESSWILFLLVTGCTAAYFHKESTKTDTKPCPLLISSFC
ncbi:uncharacterized protein Tco025E_07544 [Trypanosoma conorhini]|uniref:Uncharacterized protein n=1 Tax=Trypanosoma conorhini TaxID=83891 RepID=A0A3R7KET0_9TRYP|nr:uncharacterized protein Tco025E_07544 [Trypanosoma conorhini]RNF06488.1 hypothetical protein Tco025E_07544 [Trypanosoma conorhini]